MTSATDFTLRTNGSDGKAISARRYTYDNAGNITQLRDIVTGMVHNYSYDGYYQLTGGSGQATDNTGNAYYGITVDYDRMHRPVAKNQQMGQRGMLFPGDVTVGYGLNYNYSATHKFRLESVYRHHFRSEADEMVEGDVIHDLCRFSYDSNGNMTGIVTDRPAAHGHTERRIAERKLLWDEENRLRAVDDNGFISCYFYDHTGRRTIKLTGGGRHTYVNGSADTDSTDTRNCTIYPSANTVFSFSDGAYRQGRLSRHIYAGNERILTAVSLRKPVLTSASGTSRRPFEAQKDTLQSLVKQIYADCGVPFKGSDNTAPSSGPVIDAESVYFYHPDHLGSTTLLTDATGSPTQRVEYAPFGELFLDRRDGTTWHTPYLFNAKELDEETGLYYYGARYYDPHLSLWISPDPLERKYPFFSTYSYTMNNPVRFADFWGLDAEDRVRIARSMFGIPYPYPQETNYKLRTENTREALAFMDCSEFVCRVMAADGITDKVESMSSSALKKFLSNTDKFFHSFKAEIGDIALWDGHTGIVSGLGEGKTVVIAHASNKDHPTGDNPAAILPEKYTTKQFLGYYRPVNEVVPDNNIYNGGTLDEVVFTAPAPKPKPLNIKISMQLSVPLNEVPIAIPRPNSQE